MICPIRDGLQEALRGDFYNTNYAVITKQLNSPVVIRHSQGMNVAVISPLAGREQNLKTFMHSGTNSKDGECRKPVAVTKQISRETKEMCSHVVGMARMRDTSQCTGEGRIPRS